MDDEVSDEILRFQESLNLDDGNNTDHEEMLDGIWNDIVGSLLSTSLTRTREASETSLSNYPMDWQDWQAWQNYDTSLYHADAEDADDESEPFYSSDPLDDPAYREAELEREIQRWREEEFGPSSSSTAMDIGDRLDRPSYLRYERSPSPAENSDVDDFVYSLLRFRETGNESSLHRSTLTEITAADIETETETAPPAEEETDDDDPLSETRVFQLPLLRIEQIFDRIYHGYLEVEAEETHERSFLDTVVDMLSSYTEAQPAQQTPTVSEIVDKLGKRMLSRGDPDALNECIICQEHFGYGKMLYMMPCKHEYHGHCIEEWLRVKATCPICRGSAFSEEAIIDEPSPQHSSSGNDSSRTLGNMQGRFRTIEESEDEETEELEGENDDDEERDSFYEDAEPSWSIPHHETEISYATFIQRYADLSISGATNRSTRFEETE
ncbi:hypothetical protein EC973_000153 [Apophysomyces ossiformis]|uniref:RING-type domain-containing protein n=1 Tax=Apophysomyces ossiformis TaxID=679940 RepID=A0A8H7ETK1_9FUNG|nr:hypothetical protein EC973_000153 [Apophysomyces ossiformis]